MLHAGYGSALCERDPAGMRRKSNEQGEAAPRTADGVRRLKPAQKQAAGQNAPGP